MYSTHLLPLLPLALAASTPPTPSQTCDQLPSGANIGNPILTPNTNDIIPAGTPYRITWTATSSGPVDLLLLRGPSENVLPHGCIVNNIPNKGQFLWHVPADLEPDVTHYGLQIIEKGSGDFQYSTQFGISAPKRKNYGLKGVNGTTAVVIPIGTGALSGTGIQGGTGVPGGTGVLSGSGVSSGTGVPGRGNSTIVHPSLKPTQASGPTKTPAGTGSAPSATSTLATQPKNAGGRVEATGLLVGLGALAAMVL